MCYNITLECLKLFTPNLVHISQSGNKQFGGKSPQVLLDVGKEGILCIKIIKTDISVKSISAKIIRDTLNMLSKSKFSPNQLGGEELICKIPFYSIPIHKGS